MPTPDLSGLDALTPEAVAARETERKLDRVNLHAADLRARLAEERKLNERLERELATLSRIAGQAEPPAWTTKTPKPGKHHATPWLMLSDLHLDEIVQPAEVMGVNAYNREIAEQRLERTASNFVQMCHHYMTGVNYDGVVVALGGDIFSGEIHDELRETNADTMLGSVAHWLGPLGAVLSLMADEFGKVHVPVVVGNHGRTTRKPRAKLRVRSNFDWFIAVVLAQMFATDKRVTFQISESADCLVPCYGQRVMLTHGDQATGGSGIGGIWPPLMRLDAKKRGRMSAVGNPYDLLVMGHWHQLVYGPQFIVNGSLKGYDEYAFTSNFGYEVPQQAAWLMTPENGRTVTFPVFCQDRAAEGW